jgi:hypothetical protein
MRSLFGKKQSGRELLSAPKGRFHGICNGVAFSGQCSAGTKKNDSRLTYWGVVDLIDGNGTERGYFSHEHSAGRETGTFEGTVTTTAGGIVLSGAWTLSNRPDNLPSIACKGTYNARIGAGMNIEIQCIGSEQAQVQAAAHYK